MAQPILSHRGPEFLAILERVEKLLQPILGTRNPVMLFAGSGTGVMEASLANIMTPGDRLLVCVNGQFGERFAAIGRALGAQIDALETPWGHALDPNAIEKRVSAADYRAVIVVHNESSTGVVADLAAIGSILRNHPALLVVDSVSGLGGIEMRQDEWGIDILVSASQKALMCPPGAALASVNPKAWEVVRKDHGLPRFYWDFRKAMNREESLETPFTPPISLIYGLHEALEMIHAEGVPAVLDRHRRLAAELRAGCNALGLPNFQHAGALSSTVVVLRVPEKFNGSDIVRLLYERYRTVIAGSRNKLSGRVIRIGCMGDIQDADIATDLKHLESVLQELGAKVAANAR